MWKEIKNIENIEVDVYIIEAIQELCKLTNTPYEDLEERFNVLNDYENTPAHEMHQRIALYNLCYEINKIKMEKNDKKMLDKTN